MYSPSLITVAFGGVHGKAPLCIICICKTDFWEVRDDYRGRRIIQKSRKKALVSFCID
ncbi:hypothetical protein PORCRE_1167 [Porphyromonas crevioricanis JCM 15906]|uniref:Uncharacterized protein n=1 Tax=Porphyromonas crevioricanis JCM 15906 TaxID=1305617 RepID=T1DRW7_9PORP|nr:hypothetical protein PORCRE_1167 [Porphyromonas crevioricanis JCM 15906]